MNNSLFNDLNSTKVVTSTIVTLILGISGCASNPLAKSTQTTAKTLPQVDITQPEGFFEPYKPAGFDLGPFLIPWEKGDIFRPAQRTVQDSALVYLYRPDSAWSRAEVVPASIFLNGERIPSLQNNHHYWLELPAGTYRMAIRRPLPPVYFQRGVVIDFEVDAGKTYYLRYAEQYYVDPPDKSLGLLFKRPIAQMPKSQALKEIDKTRAKTPGLVYVNNPNAVTETSKLQTVSGRPYNHIDNNAVKAKEVVHIAPDFRFYNPLTW